jgi:hypothetical protein
MDQKIGVQRNLTSLQLHIHRLPKPLGLFDSLIEDIVFILVAVFERNMSVKM